jgi:hypothetical protein
VASPPHQGVPAKITVTLSPDVVRQLDALLETLAARPADSLRAIGIPLPCPPQGSLGALCEPHSLPAFYLYLLHADTVDTHFWRAILVAGGNTNE